MHLQAVPTVLIFNGTSPPMQHRKRIMKWLLAAMLLFTPLLALGSSPTAYDIALRLRVVSSTNPDMRPGTTGVLEFTIESLMQPYGADFVLVTSRDPPNIPLGGLLQPIRLLAHGVDTCHFAEVTNNPFWTPFYYYLSNGLSPGDVATCSVGFEILAAATRPVALSFEVSLILGNSSIVYYDNVPANNTVSFPFGGSPSESVPVGHALGWWVMLLAFAMLAALAVRRRVSQRRGLFCSSSRPPSRAGN